ncbi:hypothetical protein [Corallococcus aberystwythensis]|uniref:Uncharacterized protein n=1 Tax=Corallococcus aberystwythensis TaxID=2316722 RepID=A0A3A8P5S0_9BACT|nr:hypothetical protein [Corallococcus aberystwythensis]RKH51738.1 hypothetical protein D7W81_40345 [Corallococcus aberystwythensis]
MMAFATAACAAGVPARGAAGVYAARPAPLAGRTGGSASGPTWSWLEREQLRPDTGSQSEEELLDWLIAGDPAQRAEAQVRLLSRGAALLPGLEALATRARDGEARAALLEFIQVLTKRRIHPDLLGGHPELSALSAKAVARGMGLVAFWETEPAPRELIEELPVRLCGNEPLTDSRLRIEGRRLQELRDKLGTLGGLALPGVERLLASPSATVRLQGIVLAAALGLRPGQAALERLRNDPGEVEMEGRHADSDVIETAPLASWRSKVSLSKRASLVARKFGASWREVRGHDTAVNRAEAGIIEWFGAVRTAAAADDSLRPTERVSEDLITGLRLDGGWDVTDAQQYWNHVRPVWRLFWRTFGPDLDDSTRGEWFALLNSRNGFQIRRETGSGDETVVRVETPAGEEAELVTFPHGVNAPVVVQRGVLPLTLSSKQPVYTLGIRLRLGGDWVDSGPFFAPPQEGRMTVWLQPELFLRYLKERADLHR